MVQLYNGAICFQQKPYSEFCILVSAELMICGPILSQDAASTAVTRAPSQPEKQPAINQLVARMLSELGIQYAFSLQYFQLMMDF